MITALQRAHENEIKRRSERRAHWEAQAASWASESERVRGYDRWGTPTDTYEETLNGYGRGRADRLYRETIDSLNDLHRWQKKLDETLPDPTRADRVEKQKKVYLDSLARADQARLFEEEKDEMVRWLLM